MSTATTESSQPDAGTVDRNGAVTEAYAFGLGIEVPAHMGAMLPAGRRPGAPRTRIIDIGLDGIKRLWREGGRAEELRGRQYPNGRPMWGIDYSAAAGYRVWAPPCGRFVVPHDASTIYAAPRYSNGWEWQRLFFAQVLPLAAVLQGLEPLHASAVALSGHAVAFSAPSGTGKTSLAAHLVARGAALIADDVLVVEPTPVGPLVHPATGLISVAEHEFEQVPERDRFRLGTLIGNEEKLILLAEPPKAPLPLLALFVLERHSGIDSLTLDRLASPDPRLVLSTSFISYVRDIERLRNHLDVYGALAADVAVYRVQIPLSAPAAKVASAVEREIDDVLGNRNVTMP